MSRLPSVGWALLLGVSPIDPSFGALRARYFACFCVVTAGYSSIPLLLALTADNSGSHTQRAVALGMLNLVGQGFAILAAFLFPSAEGPKYTKVRATSPCSSLSVPSDQPLTRPSPLDLRRAPRSTSRSSASASCSWSA